MCFLISVNSKMFLLSKLPKTDFFFFCDEFCACKIVFGSEIFFETIFSFKLIFIYRFKHTPGPLKFIPIFRPGGPFLESPGNIPGPISVFGEKCFLTEVNFC